MAAEEALRRRGSSGQSSYGGSSGTAVRENPVMRSFFGGGGDKSARGAPRVIHGWTRQKVETVTVPFSTGG